MSENEYKGSKILVVEDEETLAIGLEYNLKEEGYEVKLAKDGKIAMHYIESIHFDLIILDIMLPYLDGFTIAKRIRKKNPQQPILMLTARTSAQDKIKGLEIGADDYLTKPFHLDELLLRVRGMLKRKSWYKTAVNDTPIFRFGKNEVDFENLTSVTERGIIHLSVQEAMLLKYLTEHEGRVISRKELLQEVWNISSEIETRTVDNFILRLRKHFEPNPAQPIYFKSIRGAGYVFTSQKA